MNDSFDANITHSFYFSSTVLKTESAFISAVKAKYPFAVEYNYDASYTQPHIRDLQTVQRFLHGGAQTYRVKRFFLDELHPALEKVGFTGWCIMLSYYPETDVISISFHYGIADVTADHLIVLRQSGANKVYPFPQEEISCSDLAQKFAEAFLPAVC